MSLLDSILARVGLTPDGWRRVAKCEPAKTNVLEVPEVGILSTPVRT
jgi:hypothetical protein